MRARILIVDDDEDMRDILVAHLGAEGYEVVVESSADDALKRLTAELVDVVVTDLQMPGMRGTELCGRLATDHPSLQVIVMTAHGSMEAAIEAIRAGAYDFLPKPFEPRQLELAVARALRLRELDRELHRLHQELRPAPFPRLVGESAAMRKMFSLMERLETSVASVLITGESGTGKELVARALHEQSGRSGEFVAINCAAMPETLLESELFGHARGAFTDAREDKAGLFRRADGGTLLLDEIGDMPAGLQAKLLRSLQERRVRPVGGDQEIAFDARIIAATHQNLESMVDEGRFREDLLFRLNVIHLQIPPLRSRGKDVLLLAQQFLERAAEKMKKPVSTLSRGAAEKMLAYRWPGNVRELENCMERAVAMARYPEVLVGDLPDKVRDYQPSQTIAESDDPAELATMAEVEARYIRRVLEVVEGNKSRAAKVLGFDRKTLYRRLERYKIDA